MREHARYGWFMGAIYDFLAMVRDDAVKSAATVQLVSGVIETDDPQSIYASAEGNVSYSHVGHPVVMQLERAGHRLLNYDGGWTAANINGTAVSTIDEGRIKNLPHPCAGDYLLAVRGKPNARSNGFTKRRKICRMLASSLGSDNAADWHKTQVGAEMLAYLAAPSDQFYPAFKELLDTGAASDVMHLSGGAFEGKLAKWIARHGFISHIEALFEPHWVDLMLIGAAGMTPRQAYQQFTMGNPGFVTTDDPEKAKLTLQKHGFEAMNVAQLHRAKRQAGITFKGYDGNEIRFLYDVKRCGSRVKE